MIIIDKFYQIIKNNNNKNIHRNIIKAHSIIKLKNKIKNLFKTVMSNI